MLVQKPVQKFTCRTDKRPTRAVLQGPRGFAHDHDTGTGTAFSGDRMAATLMQ